jgi:hypothetical protein
MSTGKAYASRKMRMKSNLLCMGCLHARRPYTGFFASTSGTSHTVYYGWRDVFASTPSATATGEIIRTREVCIDCDDYRAALGPLQYSWDGGRVFPSYTFNIMVRDGTSEDLCFAGATA